jgi:hypothetical protein
MDERHHHENDPHGTFGSARAARAQMAKLDAEAVVQRALPDLKAQREQLMVDKTLIGARIANIDRYGQRHAGAELTGRVELHGRVVDVDTGRPQEGEREQLYDQLRQLSLALNSINDQINGIPPVMAASDKAAHHEDLERRAGRAST